MTYVDVEIFLVSLFIITVVFIITTAILFGIVNGDFHKYSLTYKKSTIQFIDLYEKFIHRICNF